MESLSENCALALNGLANCYLRATYVFGFIVDVLEKDELLHTITESCRLNRRIFAESFRKIVEFLQRFRWSFSLEEPPKLSPIRLQSAIEMSQNIDTMVQELQNLLSSDDAPELSALLRHLSLKTVDSDRSEKAGPIFLGHKVVGKPTTIHHTQTGNIIRGKHCQVNFELVLDVELTKEQNAGSPDSIKKEVVPVLIPKSPLETKEAVHSDDDSGLSSLPAHETPGSRSLENANGTSPETVASDATHHDRGSVSQVSQFRRSKSNPNLAERSGRRLRREAWQGRGAKSTSRGRSRRKEAARSTEKEPDPSPENGEDQSESPLVTTDTGEPPSDLLPDETPDDEEDPEEIEPSAIVTSPERFFQPEFRVLLVVKADMAHEHRERVREMRAWIGENYPAVTLVDPAEGNPTDIHLVVAVGGDGTLLKAAAHFGGNAPTPPILGFRAGRLNWLLPFDFDRRYDAVLRTALEGKAAIEERSRLACQIPSSGENVAATNDVTVHRGTYPGTVGIEVAVDGRGIARFVGDGAVVSSPTGSTGYSLSAGGPAVHPGLACLVVTAISPSEGVRRSLVLPSSSVVALRLIAGEAFVNCDGALPSPLRPNAVIEVTSHPHPLRLVVDARANRHVWQWSDRAAPGPTR